MNKLALLALALALPLSACEDEPGAPKEDPAAMPEREPDETPVLAEPGAGIVPPADSTTDVAADSTIETQ